jgi:hypothetical protein
MQAVLALGSRLLGWVGPGGEVASSTLGGQHMGEHQGPDWLPVCGHHQTMAMRGTMIGFFSPQLLGWLVRCKSAPDPWDTQERLISEEPGSQMCKNRSFEIVHILRKDNSACNQSRSLDILDLFCWSISELPTFPYQLKLLGWTSWCMQLNMVPEPEVSSSNPGGRVN